MGDEGGIEGGRGAEEKRSRWDGVRKQCILRKKQRSMQHVAEFA